MKAEVGYLRPAPRSKGKTIFCVCEVERNRTKLGRMTSDHDPARAPPTFQDNLVTVEESLFGTRLPRPTGVGRHLIVVAVVFIAALALAVAFAERQTPKKNDDTTSGEKNATPHKATTTTDR
jgi:hypothetical protein